MYDCIVIGTGAAGISAALSLRSLGMSFLLIGDKNLSAKIGRAEKIRNYPGLTGVTGGQLCAAFSSQLEAEGIEITQGKVNGVFANGESFLVACGESTYECATVILATGVETIKPIEGEREFLGRGVSYCAPCDAFLYKGKKVAAILCAREEEGEVTLLSRFAGEVELFPMCAGYGEFPENVRIMSGRPLKIAGGERVESVITDGGEVKVDGVFVLKQTTSGDALLKGLETEDGLVKINRLCETSTRGVYAAGDCTGRPFQYAKAVGEGNVAAHSAYAYLTAKKKGKR